MQFLHSAENSAVHIRCILIAKMRRTPSFFAKLIGLVRHKIHKHTYTQTRQKHVNKQENVFSLSTALSFGLPWDWSEANFGTCCSKHYKLRGIVGRSGKNLAVPVVVYGANVASDYSDWKRRRPRYLQLYNQIKDAVQSGLSSSFSPFLKFRCFCTNFYYSGSHISHRFSILKLTRFTSWMYITDREHLCLLRLSLSALTKYVKSLATIGDSCYAFD